MPSVWYIGPGVAARELSVADWAGMQISNGPKVRWGPENGWAVDQAIFSTEQLNALRTHSDFLTDQNGLRTGFGIQPGNYTEEFNYARIYYEEAQKLIANFTAGIPNLSNLGFKLDKVSTPSVLYGTNGSGGQAVRTMTSAPTPDTVPYRAASGNFQVEEATAPKDVVNRTQMDNAVNRIIKRGENLILDPLIEEPTFWGLNAGTNPAISTDRVRQGSRSFKLTATGNSFVLLNFPLNNVGGADTIVCQPGDAFYYEFWVNLPVNVAAGYLVFSPQLVDSTGTNPLSYPTGAQHSFVNGATNTWVKVSGTYTVPTGYDRIRPRIFINNTATAGAVVYVSAGIVFRSVPNDDRKLDKITTPTRVYVVDSSGNQTSVPYSESISPHTFPRRDANARIQAAPGVAAIDVVNKGQMDVADSLSVIAGDNLVIDPNLTNTDYWGTHTTVGVSLSTEKIRKGSRSIKFVQQATPQNIYSHLIRVPGTANRLPVATNGDEAFYGEVWILIPTAVSAGTFSISLWATDSTGVLSTAFPSISTLNLNSIAADTWVKASGIARIPQGYDEVGIYAQLQSSAPAGSIVYVSAGIIFRHVVTQTATWHTSNRPTANSVPAGTQIFNLTTNKPNWSDGINWRDAAGTIV